MEIELTQGKKALVDDADLWKIMPYHWYAARGSDGRWYAWGRPRTGRRNWTRIKMHRLLLDAPKAAMVDHLNGDGLDNRRDNLRLCTNEQNQQNSGARKGSSRFKGVSWNARKRKWRVAFRALGQFYYVGYFSDETEAARAYDEAILKICPEFARLNFPETAKRSAA